MPEHLVFSEHLTSQQVHRPIAETFLGQAHIAGTGPAGATCRECNFWCVIRHRKDSYGNYVTTREAPGYFGNKHKKTPLELKKARCTRPILNKANRLIPHHAKACRLFEPAENPASLVKEVETHGKNVPAKIQFLTDEIEGLKARMVSVDNSAQKSKMTMLCDIREDYQAAVELELQRRMAAA